VVAAGSRAPPAGLNLYRRPPGHRTGDGVGAPLTIAPGSITDLWYRACRRRHRRRIGCTKATNTVTVGYSRSSLGKRRHTSRAWRWSPASGDSAFRPLAAARVAAWRHCVRRRPTVMPAERGMDFNRQWREVNVARQSNAKTEKRRQKKEGGEMGNGGTRCKKRVALSCFKRQHVIDAQDKRVRIDAARHCGFSTPTLTEAVGRRHFWPHMLLRHTDTQNTATPRRNKTDFDRTRVRTEKKKQDTRPTGNDGPVALPHLARWHRRRHCSRHFSWSPETWSRERGGEATEEVCGGGHVAVARGLGGGTERPQPRELPRHAGLAAAAHVPPTLPASSETDDDKSRRGCM